MGVVRTDRELTSAILGWAVIAAFLGGCVSPTPTATAAPDVQLEVHPGRSLGLNASRGLSGVLVTLGDGVVLERGAVGAGDDVWIAGFSWEAPQTLRLASEQVTREWRIGAWTPPLEATVQPGADYGGCNLSFLFLDSVGSIYASTAAHCGDVGRTETIGDDPLGTVIFADERLDVALIRLSDDAPQDVSPSMRHFGGPTAIDDWRLVRPGDKVCTYGHGAFWHHDVLLPRCGTLDHASQDSREKGAPAILYSSALPTTSGDSGAPVIHADTGMALGPVSSGLHGTLTSWGSLCSTMARAALEGVALRLWTAPLTGADAAVYYPAARPQLSSHPDAACDLPVLPAACLATELVYTPFGTRQCPTGANPLETA